MLNSTNFPIIPDFNLLPCPFCGGSAEVVKIVENVDGLGSDAFAGVCTSCFSVGKPFFEPVDASYFWNNRTRDVFFSDKHFILKRDNLLSCPECGSDEGIGYLISDNVDFYNVASGKIVDCVGKCYLFDCACCNKRVIGYTDFKEL